MLEKTYMVTCDICGKMEPARKKFDSYNEEIAVVPSNWFTGANADMHICSDCGDLLASNGRLKRKDESYHVK